MTTKDWVLMLVPIAVNGVLIFAFQKFVQSKLNKSIRVDERKKVIIDRFLSMLMDLDDAVSETERRFCFREDLEDVNERFKIVVSELCRYGGSVDSVLKMKDDLGKLSAMCGYCHNKLVRYESLGEQREHILPLAEQSEIIDDLTGIKRIVRSLIARTIEK